MGETGCPVHHETPRPTPRILRLCRRPAEPPDLPGGPGPGRGKRIVLIAGDQEYRSEESIPALAHILAERHGFQCTVLFSVNPKTGPPDPNTIDNIPGLEALRRADLLVPSPAGSNCPTRR